MQSSPLPECEQTTVLEYRQQWEAYKPQRARVFRMCLVGSGCVAVCKVIAASAFDTPLSVDSMLVLFVVCVVASMSAKVRNNLSLLCWASVFWTTMCVAIVLMPMLSLLHQDAPNIFSLEKNNHELLLIAAIRVQPVPFMSTVTFAVLGLPMRFCLPQVFLLFVVHGVFLVCARHRAQGMDVPTIFSMSMAQVFFAVTTIYFAWTSEKHQHLSRKNYTLLQHNVQQRMEEKERDRLTRTRIVSYIFHEVRNPLNNIVLAVDLLLGRATQQHHTNPSPENNELFELLDTIAKASASACHVLNDALSLQKLETGSFEFDKRPFSLVAFQEQAVRVFAPQMLQKQIRLTSEIDPSVAHLYVNGDFNRLQQVLTNFLSNSYKFTPNNGSVVLRTTKVSESFVGSSRIATIRTCVEDSGAGIAEVDHQRVFQAWSQIRASDLQQGQGSGLGLSLCKAFVELGHNGRIGFTSELNKGSSFYFEIDFEVVSNDFYRTTKSEQQATKPPMIKRSNTRTRLETFVTKLATKISTDKIQVKSVEMTDSTNCSSHELDVSINSIANCPDVEIERHDTVLETKAHDFTRPVLVVDDSLVTRKLMSKMLAALGVAHDLCENGKEVVERIVDNGGSYQIIFMDKEMPVMDGFEATRALREADYHFPIIGLTGNAMDEQVHDFLRAGADRVFTKPISRATLVQGLTEYNVATVSDQMMQ